MTDNVITISLDDVLGPDGLDGAREAMKQGLVQRVESKFLHSDTGGKSFHSVAVDAINEAVRNSIAAKIEGRLRSPILLTDNYGNQTGETTTFDQMIGDAVEAAMSQPLDVYGKPSSSGKTLLQQALQGLALEGLAAAVKKEARAVNQQAKHAVAQEVAKAIAATIK